MKRYIKDGEFYDGVSIVVDDVRIIHPSEEQLLAAGYVEYVEPEPTLAEKLALAKLAKIEEITEYDASPAVNSFYLSGSEMWLTVEERQQIATQISACEAIGREDMTRWFGGRAYTFTLTEWKQMLVAVEVYAGDAVNVTEGHKAAVNALRSVKAVEDYDYTAGYPEKLNF